jgi:hypothetical protein
VAAAAGGGALLNRGTDAPPVPVVANARTGSATDEQTGASMSVALQPAAGWVRVRAAVSGVAAGQQCRLYVLARSGERREAGSWLVSEAAESAGTTVDGSALIAPADVSGVQVETFAGRVLVSVPV